MGLCVCREGIDRRGRSEEGWVTVAVFYIHNILHMQHVLNNIRMQYTLEINIYAKKTMMNKISRFFKCTWTRART